MTKLHAIVNFDNNGEVVCFCSYEEYEAGRCACRNNYDCPEAMIEINVIPGTKPSEQVTSQISAKSRELKSNLRDIEKSASKIKEGLSNLEKSLKGRKDFRI